MAVRKITKKSEKCCNHFSLFFVKPKNGGKDLSLPPYCYDYLLFISRSYPDRGKSRSDLLCR